MNKIYVGNLSYQLTEQTLEAAFTECGEIVDLVIIRDRETKRSKGFGFVEFATPEAAQEALKLDGQPIDNRPAKISLARERTSSSRNSGNRSRNRAETE